MSDHDTLAAALAAFQADLPTIDKGQTAKIKSDKGSYSYQYADLADVSARVLPLLAAQGLSFTSLPTFDGDRFVLTYRLMHTSGDALEGTYPLPNGQPQQVGSAITYARRYCLCAVTGVAPDEDDDGQAAQQAPPASKGKAPSKPKPSGGQPSCARCGDLLAGVPVAKVDGQFVHKGQCPPDDDGSASADNDAPPGQENGDASGPGKPATSEADRSGGDDGSEQASTSSPPDTQEELPCERADRLDITPTDQMVKLKELSKELKATIPARRQYIGTGRCHPGLSEAFVAWLDEVEASKGAA